MGPGYLSSVFDGGSIQHGHIVHPDTLPYDGLTLHLEHLLTVGVGQVQEAWGVTGVKVMGVRSEVKG